MSTPGTRLHFRGRHLINELLIAGGTPEVELHKGEGYFYFEFNREEAGRTVQHHTLSIMVYHLRSYTTAEWVKMGEEFARQCRAGTYDELKGRL